MPFCREAITRPLSPLRDDEAISCEDGKPAIREGFFALGGWDCWSIEGVLVNLHDLVGIKHHPHRLNGCCELDGLDGPNLLCPKKHEIGTEKSDCWMSHAAILVKNVCFRSRRSFLDRSHSRMTILAKLLNATD